MKAHYLGSQRQHSTEHLRDEFGDDGHDLGRGLKTCKVPASRAAAPPTVLRGNGKQVPTSMLHQAWRYGADLDKGQALAFVAWLDKLYSWLQEVVG